MANWGTSLRPSGAFGQNPSFFQTFEETEREKACDRERESVFIYAVIDGHRNAVKIRWKNLCNYRWRHDFNALLDRAQQYSQGRYLNHKYKQWIVQWITKTALKLEGEKALASKCYEIKNSLLSAAHELHLDDLRTVVEQMKEIYADRPALAPAFFRMEWQEAANIVQRQPDSEKKEEILAFIHDAIQRIESKKALLIVADRLHPWNQEQSKKIEAIYADRTALFPLSLQTVASDWTSAKECVDSNRNALSIISNAEERLQQGQSLEIEDFDDGFP